MYASQGGRIISQLQTATGTRVKLSQKNEFFPGTHDRVALVQGEQPTMVAEAVAEMLRRLREVRVLTDDYMVDFLVAVRQSATPSSPAPALGWYRPLSPLLNFSSRFPPEDFPSTIEFSQHKSSIFCYFRSVSELSIIHHRFIISPPSRERASTAACVYVCVSSLIYSSGR